MHITQRTRYERFLLRHREILSWNCHFQQANLRCSQCLRSICTLLPGRRASLPCVFTRVLPPSVGRVTHTPHARTLNEFNIKSAIKLKTFCYVLNNFRPVYFSHTNKITPYPYDETAKFAHHSRF